MTQASIAAPRTLNPGLVLLTASTGCAMTVLDTNIVAIVLPTIARDLKASFADVEWVVSTYVLCFAALLLPAGAVADRYGRRRVFLTGITLFAFASLLCGAAPTASSLYAARALQGAGAAFLLAPALATIGHTFHAGAERDHAWAVWGTIMGLTMVLAPVLGGVVAWLLGWRWAFFINLPICLLLGAAVLLFVGESADAMARKLDPFGILLFAATMFGFTFGLINGQAHGWTAPGTLAGFIGGVLALTGFITAERLQERPMLDLTLFRLPRFIGAVLAMFAYAACAQVMASLLPLLLQNGLGRSAVQAGFSMLPFALAMLVFPHMGRKLAKRWASFKILVLGLSVVGLGSLIVAWGAHLAMTAVIMTGMAVLGAGGGLLNGETQKAIMGTVPPTRAGMASGISTTARFSGILMGFAVLSGVLATMVRGALSNAACMAARGTACDAARRFADAVVAGDVPHAVARLSGAARDAAIASGHLAFAQGFATALLVAAGFAGLAALLVARLMRPAPDA